MYKKRIVIPIIGLVFLMGLALNRNVSAEERSVVTNGQVTFYETTTSTSSSSSTTEETTSTRDTNQATPRSVNRRSSSKQTKEAYSKRSDYSSLPKMGSVTNSLYMIFGLVILFLLGLIGINKKRNR